MLTRPVSGFDMVYADRGVDAVFAATNGQPFLTQAVAFELVQFLNEQHLRQATSADIEIATTRALDSAANSSRTSGTGLAQRTAPCCSFWHGEPEMPERFHQDVLA